MLHGLQKLTLTHESVMEALQDFLQKHMGAKVYVKVGTWATTPNVYGEATIDIEFGQTEDAPGPSCPDQTSHE